VAAVLRGTGNHVRLVVARPANPVDPTIIRPNAPILPSSMLTDQIELEKHLSSTDVFAPIVDDLLEPPILQQQQLHHHLVDQTTSPIRADDFVARYFCGLYYKPMTIVNDDSRVVNKLEASLTDDARVIIYDCHMFIVQATG
jgi:hypothetical protein